MQFRAPLRFGRLIRRYKRFLADVELDDGEIVTAHCTNTGSLKTCSKPGWRVALSRSDNPKRKYPYTWELVHNGKTWIGINTLLANRLAEEAIRRQRIPELTGYPTILREKRYGRNSRIDLLLERPSDAAAPEKEATDTPSPVERCYVEVKNVSMLGETGDVAFPDAVTERGRKHLRELEQVVRDGNRGVMLFVVQRVDGNRMRPAWEIDPAWGNALLHAVEHGVEALAYQAEVSPAEIVLLHPLKIDLTPPE